MMRLFTEPVSRWDWILLWFRNGVSNTALIFVYVYLVFCIHRQVPKECSGLIGHEEKSVQRVESDAANFRQQTSFSSVQMLFDCFMEREIKLTKLSMCMNIYHVHALKLHHTFTYCIFLHRRKAWVDSSVIILSRFSMQMFLAVSGATSHNIGGTRHGLIYPTGECHIPTALHVCKISLCLWLFTCSFH